MKKILSFITLILILVCLLASCGGGHSDGPNSGQGGNNNPLEHTHSFGEWTTVTEPTCFAEGLSERECSCGEKEMQNIPVGDHKFADNGNECICLECGILDEDSFLIDISTALNKQDGDIVRVSGTVYDINGQSIYITDDDINTICIYKLPAEVSIGDFLTVRGTLNTYHGEREIRDFTSYFVNYHECIFEIPCFEDTRCIVCGKENTTPIDHDYTIIEQRDATCMPGYIRSTCNTCGQEKWEELEPIYSHTEIVVPGYAPSCTTAGLSDGKKCSACNEILVWQQELSATGHNPVIDEAVAPTCTSPGLTQGKHCSVCNKIIVKQNTVKATGHTEVIDAAVAATCTETGLSQGKHCSVCNEVLIAQIEVPLLAHTYSSDSDLTCNKCGYTRECSHTDTYTVSAKAPTCTRSGLTEGIRCRTCKEYLVAREVIPALGHTEVIDKAVDPTCTETGLTEGKHCSVCNATIIAQITVPANGHTEVIDEAVKATCITTGLTEGSHCSVCNVIVIAQRTVPASGHTEVVDQEVAPTCTKTGLTEGKHCSVCNEIIVAQTTVPANGHTEVVDEAVEPTCTETGLTEGKHCSVCNKILVAQISVPANGHSEIVDGATAATCTEMGHTEGKHCSVCDKILIPQKVIDALGHEYINNICTRCECKALSPGLYDKDNTLIATWDSLINEYTMDVTRSYTSSTYKTSVTSPYYVLNNYSELNKGVNLVIDNSVTNIGSYAFYDCDGLSSITIPDSITSIGSMAFYGCKNLTSVNISDIAAWCNISFSDSNSNPLSYGKNLHLNGGLVTQLNIPDSVTNIGSYAFQGCTSLTSITIPESVTSISNYAFEKCYNIVEIINNSSLSITSDFSNCVIEVHIGESKIVYWKDYLFYTYNGVNYLFRYIGSDTELVLPDNYNGESYEIHRYAFYDCNSITSIAIPDSVTSIGSYAFYGCTSLTSISFGDNGQLTNIGDSAFEGCRNLTSIDFGNNSQLTSIGDYAFYNCESLTSITIPDSITSIGYYAFKNCSNLNSVYITDIAAWCNISFTDHNSNPLCYAKNLYLNGELVTDLVIPIEVTHINKYAFYGCESLMSVDFEYINRLSYIGDYAFEGCTSLKAVYISDIVAWCNISFSDYLCHFDYSNPLYYAKNLYLNGELVTDLVIPTEVRNIGFYAFYNCTSLKHLAFGNYSQLTNIGYGAFRDCTSLTSVGFGDNSQLTSIDYEAFYNCTSLTNIVIPDSVESIGGSAFYNCISLTSADFGDNSHLTSIGGSAFYNCTSLIKIAIPDSVKSIGYGTFRGCTSLTSVDFGDNSHLTSIGGSAFYNCTNLTNIVIPDSVTSIGGSAFYNCTSLTNIVIPDSVTNIGDSAFYDCTSLLSVNISDVAAWCNVSFKNSTSNPLYYANNLYLNGELVTDLLIPDGVTRIGDYAFYNCTSLTSIDFGDDSQLTSIGYEAFYNCTSLTSVDFGDNSQLTSIGGSAFYGCASLASVNISNVAAWCNLSFSVIEGPIIHYTYSNPLYYANNLYLNGELLTDLVIPDGVTKIRDYAFYCCKGLTSIKSITIPNSVTSIDYFAFNGCINLTSIRFEDNSQLTSIGGRAFYNCTSLTSIDFGDNSQLTSIGYEAFYDCTSLLSVNILDVAAWCNVSFKKSTSNPLYYANNLYLNGELATDLIIPDGVTRIGDYAFYNCTNLTRLTVPVSVTSIGSCVFQGCSSLESITLPFVGATFNGTENTHFGYIFGAESDYFNNSYVPSNLKTVVITSAMIIDDDAFCDCTGITSIAIHDSVTSIGSSAFHNCTSLTSVDFGDNSQLTSIDNYAFRGCTSLTSVDFGDNSQLTSIGDYAFEGCTSLTSIFIPNSVKTIYSGAFYNCTSLVSVDFGDSAQLTKISGGPFDDNGAFEGCISLTSIVIPDSVTSIGNRAFRECTSLMSIDFGDNSQLTSIGGSAFYNCTKLTSVNISDVAAWCDISFGNYASNPLYYAKSLYLNGELVTDLVIPDSVTSIGSSAFYNCTSLTSITIPDSVTSIGGSAFNGCTNIESITLPFVGATKDGSDLTYLGHIFGAPANGNNGDFVPSSLKTVVITSATSIGEFAFWECTSIASIVIPDSVTSIGYVAFWGCTSLTDVYYTGTEEEWAAISIGSNNTYLTNATIHYNYVPEE